MDWLWYLCPVGTFFAASCSWMFYPLFLKKFRLRWVGHVDDERTG